MDYAYFTKRKKRLFSSISEENNFNTNTTEVENSRLKCYHLIETLKLMNQPVDQNLPDDSFFHHRTTFYEIIL